MFDPEEEFKKVNDHWGDKMPMMAYEEMAELIQAISKLERHISKEYQNDTKEEFLRESVAREMADVYISCQALMIRYEIDESDVLHYIKDKLLVRK